MFWVRTFVPYLCYCASVCKLVDHPDLCTLAIVYEGIILDNHSFCVTILVCCELCLAMLTRGGGCFPHYFVSVCKLLD